MIEKDDQQEKWDQALLGEATPDSDDPVGSKAHTVRQMVLWESTQSGKNLIPPHQASSFYKQVVRTNRKRKWTTVGLYGALSLLILSLGYFFILPATIERNNTDPVNIDPRNLNTQNTILDTPYMMTIPSGNYTMGCENGWDDKLGSCSRQEKPPHTVNVTTFALSKYETTFAQFKKFVDETGYLTVAEVDDAGCTVTGELAGKDTEWVPSKKHNWKDPGFPQQGNHPVVCVSWSDAQAYINWYSSKTGTQYRLPTEEEWEYAARAGTFTMYYWGNSPDRSYTNYRGTEENDKWKYTSPVGSLSPNNFGIHDVSGNVWEWVKSCWRPNYRTECPNQDTKTRRGGSWFDSPRNIRLAYKGKNGKNARSVLNGFRIAHDIN